ncbi:Dabb family protein [Puteibacter caeruleilacunae]|nr:Dabb family protein [Puteibacter caeruleilacunae]
MIKHIVLFKVKEFESDVEKQEALDKMKDQLLALEPIIDELKFIEVGLNHELNSANYDLCLTTHFESMDDLKVYANHPEHLKVVDYVKTIAVQRACVDYKY